MFLVILMTFTNFLHELNIFTIHLHFLYLLVTLNEILHFILSIKLNLFYFHQYLIVIDVAKYPIRHCILPLMS